MDRKCKYCGKPLEEGHRRRCEECDNYCKMPLYRKLGLLEGPLKERYFKALEILKDLYFVQKLSAPEIWKRTGVNFRTMRDLFRENNLKTRNLSEGGRVAVETGRLKLPVFGEGYQYKHGWHETWEGKKAYYRSSYELEFAQELDKQRIPYEMESQKIRYFDTEKKVERTAIPDFYLPETNELVEIKSIHTYGEQNMKDRFKAYREHGFKPKLYLERKELEI